MQNRPRLQRRIRKAGVMPPLPKPAKNGSVPAIEYARADIAREVVQRRISAGMTRRELAVRAGVTPQTIRQLEAGKCLPRIGTMDRIDRVLPALHAR